MASTYAAPALEDLDGDGVDELIVGQGDGTIKYFANMGTVGSPTFVLKTGADDPLDGITASGSSRAVPRFADIDGDGDMDLILGGASGELKYFENTGHRHSAGFTERTGVANPFDGLGA